MKIRCGILIFALKLIIGTASLYYFLISAAAFGLGLLCGLVIFDYLLPTEDHVCTITET
jgi:hypothetical protein